MCINTFAHHAAPYEREFFIAINNTNKNRHVKTWRLGDASFLV
jgi:hypothetical protein